MNNDDKHDPEIKVIEDNLHDLVNWLQSGIVLPLEEMAEEVKRGNYRKIGELLPGFILQAKSVLNEVRDIQRNVLKRREHRTRDLLVSLRELTTIWLTRVGLQGKRTITVDCPQQFKLPELTREALLAITDEAISNAIKYSGFMTHAKTGIGVTVKSNDYFVTLEIQDNGHGARKIVEGYGFKKIRRVLAELQHAGFDSNLEITTSAGKGFILKVNIRHSTIE